MVFTTVKSRFKALGAIAVVNEVLVGELMSGVSKAKYALRDLARLGDLPDPLEDINLIEVRSVYQSRTIATLCTSIRDCFPTGECDGQASSMTEPMPNRQRESPSLSPGRFDSNQHVLDAGCGVGTTAIQLASRYGSRVTAIDISPPLVERATVNVQAAGLEDRITVQQGDILDLKFPDNTFDRVVIEAVSMFVNRDQATRELVRVCKPGGYVVDHEAYFSRNPTDDIIESSQHLFPGLELDETPAVWAERYQSGWLTDIKYVNGRSDSLTRAL